MARRRFWTNPSVLDLAGDRDPVEVIVERAQQQVLEAVEKGWEGPPFDPFKLADLLSIPVAPRQELADARTVPTVGGRVCIEYNPTRPPGRLRFSVAHEIAHTFFPDVAELARYRSTGSKEPTDSWQLELLCNIAAGELLMPTETLEHLDREPLDIERLLGFRRRYDVSTEALLRRVAKLTTQPAAVFAAARLNADRASSAFRLDYLVGSRAWSPKVNRGLRIPSKSVLSECTAIGYTAKRKEDWSSSLSDVSVECVGIPAYPGERYPRVVGLLRPDDGQAAPVVGITYVRGDATAPRGEGVRIIAHLVNDRTPNWGGKFARALRSQYPVAQDEFRYWATSSGGNLALGNVHFTMIESNLGIVTMVAQHGYGPSPRPRLRYLALRECLEQLAKIATAQEATIHLPRIGAGEAGGRWEVIRELIDDTLCRKGVAVTVYTLPGEDFEDQPSQGTLKFGA
jgi:O-acetyl-ADP-ribose deacetylase (regulator of RNase III)